MNATAAAQFETPPAAGKTVRGICLGFLFLGLGGAIPSAFGANFPPQGDDATPSMGLFRIIVDPAFRVLMDPTGPPTSYLGYLGYHSVDGRMTSPTLVDTATTIGRSSRNNRFYVFPGAGIPIGAGSWDVVFGYGEYPAIPFQFFAAPANTEEVLTEIKKFILSTDPRSDQKCDPRIPYAPINWPMVKAGTFAGVAPRSLGMLQGNVPNGPAGPDLPARSFFDIFVEVNLPPLPSTASIVAFPPGGAILTNDTPLIVTNFNLTTLPPSVMYIHGATPAAVPLRFKFNNPPYWAAGDLFGTLVLAGHGTFTNDCSNEAALAAAVLGPLGTSASELPIGWLRPNRLCPSPASSYDSVKNEDIFKFAIPGFTIQARNFVHTNFPNPINPPPVNGSATYSAPATLVTLEISVDGQSWLPAQVTGPLVVKISNTTTGTVSTVTYDTEMLQLNLSGNSPFGPISLRESPTRATLGKHTIGPDPRGFRISSFFDVWLEISTDNGQSWVPADRAVHVQASAPAAAPNSITIRAVPGAPGLQLQWLGNFPLLSSPKLGSPFTPITGQVSFDGILSTYHIQPSTAAAMFFRLGQ